MTTVGVKVLMHISRYYIILSLVIKDVHSCIGMLYFFLIFGTILCTFFDICYDTYYSMLYYQNTVVVFF